MTSIIKNDSSAIIYLFRMDPDRRKMRRRKGLVDWDTRSVCDERDSTCATSGRPDRWTRASPISPRSNFLFFFVAAACEWEELLPGSSSFFSQLRHAYTADAVTARTKANTEKARLMPSDVGKDNCVESHSYVTMRVLILFGNSLLVKIIKIQNWCTWIRIQVSFCCWFERKTLAGNLADMGMERDADAICLPVVTWLNRLIQYIVSSLLKLNSYR